MNNNEGKTVSIRFENPVEDLATFGIFAKTIHYHKNLQVTSNGELKNFKTCEKRLPLNMEEY